MQLRRSPIRRGARLAAVVLTTVVASCSPVDPVAHVPETVGVVKARTLVGKDLRFELADGRVFSSPANMAYVGGSSPTSGDLLLTSSNPEPWVYRATPESQSPANRPLCYRLYGRARASGDQIFVAVPDPGREDFTLALSKAPGWMDVGSSGDQLYGGLTYINEAGQAFEQRFASVDG